MTVPGKSETRIRKARQAGFSFVELVVVLAILTAVAAIILSIMSQMSRNEGTLANRTEMHAGVRSATELMQQEIGQAGRVATPTPMTTPVTLSSAVLGDATSQSPTVTSTAGLFPGEIVMFGPESVNGSSRELATLTAIGGSTVTAIFQDPHASGAPLVPQGVFASGIVPPTGSTVVSWSTGTNSTAVTTLTAGSTPGSSADLLKMYGDINGDGNMVYVEYACNQGTPSAPGTLTRLVIPFDTTSPKTSFTPETLLSNVLANPGGTPCFAYQTKVVQNNTYVIDVAVTLTVQTQNVDPQTGQFQTETKALLNVSPRNVFEGWQMASLPGGTASRIQPMPQSVVDLLNP